MKKISPSLQKMLPILNDGQCHSGPSLSAQLGISRNAIWKHMQQLVTWEIPIQSTHQGYTLLQPLILLDEEALRLAGQLPASIPLSILATTTSTNDVLRLHPKPVDFECCLAEYQSQGRGRFGRSWTSPFASNIILSAKWRLHHDLSKLGGLSLVIGLSILKSLQSLGIDKLKMKWPNDILHENRKLAGILVEIQAEIHGQLNIVIGIGLNVNFPSQPSFLTTPTASSPALDPKTREITSLQAILGSYQNRNAIAGPLIQNLYSQLKIFQKEGFSAFHSAWQKADALENQPIALLNGQELTQGIARGINEEGNLLLENEAGQIHAYSAGEVTLHPFPDLNILPRKRNTAP